jgi:hypothetical protein
MDKVSDLSKQKFFNKDFSDMDLKGVPMDHSVFTLCKFKNADISGNDCSYSNFSGSDLTDVIANSTNFAHSQLGCRFFPKDAYGITLTLECKTFQGMVVGKLWWYAWLYFAAIMLPEKDEGKDLVDILIKAIGSQKYLTLKKIFEARRM